MNEENKFLNKKTLLILAAVIAGITLVYYFGKKKHE
jgi:sensor domain CHASE-containing protein